MSKDYWSGVSEGSKDGAGAPFRDAGESVIETLSFGMIGRSSDNKRGVRDGRSGRHKR